MTHEPGSLEERGRPLEILMVDDSSSDVKLAQVALREARVRNTLRTAKDGVEALAFLRQEGDFAGVPRPDLILLDLNMPRMDGRELLAILKADADLRVIPVVVLTTSDAEDDIVRSYELHANAYVTKPLGIEQFIRAVKAVEGFWLEFVRLPPGRIGR